MYVCMHVMYVMYVCCVMYVMYVCMYVMYVCNVCTNNDSSQDKHSQIDVSSIQDINVTLSKELLKITLTKTGFSLANSILQLFRQQIPTISTPSNLRQIINNIPTYFDSHVVTHVCINECVLYVDEYKNLQNCPICDAPRNKNGKPLLSFRYCSIVERIKLIFSNPQLCLLLRKTVEESIIKSDVSQGKIWKRTFHPYFGENPFNLAFQMMIGINYFTCVLFISFFFFF